MQAIGADSMGGEERGGAMGTIAPRPNELWGDAPKSPPHEFCLVNFLNQ